MHSLFYSQLQFYEPFHSRVPVCNWKYHTHMHFWFLCDEIKSRPKLGQRLCKDVNNAYAALWRQVKCIVCYLCSHYTDTGVLLGGMCRSLIKRILNCSSEPKMSEWIMSDWSRKRPNDAAFILEWKCSQIFTPHSSFLTTPATQPNTHTDTNMQRLPVKPIQCTITCMYTTPYPAGAAIGWELHFIFHAVL